MKIKKWLVLLVISLYALTGCQARDNSSVPTPVIPLSTSTLESANTTQPTSTARSTNTPSSTSTPVTPTATIPPPDVLTRYLENPRIVRHNKFDSSAGWNADQEISNGVLKLTGLGGDDWHGLSRNASFQEGEGIVIDFMFTPGEFFEMYLENGEWNTPPYKRIGIYINRGYADVNLFSGEEGIGSNHISGNLYPKPETWYSVFMAIGNGGDFLIIVWDPSNPGRYLRYREVIDNWKGKNWMFRTQVNEGTIIYDNFMEIDFDGIK